MVYFCPINTRFLNDHVPPREKRAKKRETKIGGIAISVPLVNGNSFDGEKKEEEKKKRNREPRLTLVGIKSYMADVFRLVAEKGGRGWKSFE